MLLSNVQFFLFDHGRQLDWMLRRWFDLGFLVGWHLVFGLRWRFVRGSKCLLGTSLFGLGGSLEHGGRL